MTQYNTAFWNVRPKAAKLLITDAEFTSNLTKKSYFTRSYGDLFGVGHYNCIHSLMHKISF